MNVPEEPTIALLPPLVANKIAAGEVVERPASVIKELVENSIDAGARQVRIEVEGAGKKLIVVDDDGDGMSPVDAELAMQRHATSKIRSAEDLHTIASHGFRGEALPSIASVSRFRLHTCRSGDHEGTEIRIDDRGTVSRRPAAPRQGTRVEVRDLFLNTPARLQFMRSDRTEEAAIVEATRALALANPALALHLRLDGRKRLDYPAQTELARTNAVLGPDFADNSHAQRIEHQGITIDAVLGLPTFHHRDSSRMWFLLNGRVIRDKMLIAALRAGYRDVMFHDRYPVAVVRIHLDPARVDVNVHPAKREVRFANPGAVRAAVVACVHRALEEMGGRSASTTTDAALAAMRPPVSSGTAPRTEHATIGGRASFSPPRAAAAPATKEMQRLLFSTPRPTPSPDAHEPEPADYGTEEPATQSQTPTDFGLPLAQIHRRYLLTQVTDGILLIDQHAAHERIRYEQFKQQMRAQTVRVQPLLTPEPWQPSSELAAWLHDTPQALTPFGIELRPLDDGHFAIHTVPALLGHLPPQELAAELAEAVHSGEDADASLGHALERWLANRACKRAITFGQELSRDAQTALLREMEQCPNIGQCNHGRPTWVKLTLHDLDRLFGRQG